MPAVLTPFVRSDAVGAILAETLLHPEQELSLAELARRTGLVQAVVHKEVSRLVETSVLTDRREGNNRLVKANTGHPLWVPMAEIISATYGPVPVLRTLLSGIETIDQAFIYGSWAARRSGEPGSPPRDIDVLVVGELPLDDLIEIQDEGRLRLGMDVNIHRTSVADWESRELDPFLAQVASRPIVALVDKEVTHV